MDNLKEKIQKDYKEAFKSGDKTKISVLKMLQSEIHNAEISKRAKSGKEESLSDAEVLDVLTREVKKRKDAISLYERGGRTELAEAERNEIEVLKSYLPEEISEEELKKLVGDAIEKSGAKSVKEMGKVMAILMPQIKGRADNSLVSKIVKESLNES